MWQGRVHIGSRVRQASLELKESDMKFFIYGHDDEMRFIPFTLIILKCITMTNIWWLLVRMKLLYAKEIWCLVNVYHVLKTQTYEESSLEMELLSKMARVYFLDGPKSIREKMGISCHSIKVCVLHNMLVYLRNSILHHVYAYGVHDNHVGLLLEA